MDSNFFIDILTKPDLLGTYIFNIVVIIFFLYIIFKSLLEIRQIRILQQKIKTPVDQTLNLFNLFYVLILLIIFVIILIIM